MSSLVFYCSNVLERVEGAREPNPGFMNARQVSLAYTTKLYPQPNSVVLFL
jgi:hypothetical protein